jgi:hypothetical protein
MTQTRQQQPPSTAMAIIDARDTPLAVQLVGEDRLQLLAEQVGRGWKVPPTPVELEVIALLCQENRWNIFARPPQVHFVKRWDNNLNKEVMTPQTSIDGMRLAASRSPRYIGPAGWSWCGDDGQWRDIWLSAEPPRAARAGIYIRGQREPVYAVALWDEWVQLQDEWVYDAREKKRVKTGNKVVAPFWAAKPAHMLAKTAEMMVIKQACPAETDSLELAHLDEIERLEVPARAEAYARIYGSNDEAFGFAGNPALPQAEYRPPRERTDIEDLPREKTAPPVVMTARRQTLIDVYANLVKEAIELHVIVGDAVDWIARAGGTDDEIIEHGRNLRALVNNKKVNNATRAAQSEPQPEPEADDDMDPGDMGEGEDWGVGDTNSGPADLAGKVLVTSKRSPLWSAFTAARAQALAEGLNVPLLELPQTEESLRAAAAELTELVAEKRGLDAAAAKERDQAPEQQQAMV